ncbi:MAG: glycosyltransferase family 4 protein [Gammaproteobacteria bacterium]|nr:glycosyltransferase family 4 protein [Gammaproteobacteria bacterium]MBL7003303.1 glycosyltransferase family 4 protein [Gammaproteobacteria bacterium]
MNINILFLTHNSSLRSTTCVLDALINKEYKKTITPVLVFADEGPWKQKLSEKGIKTYVKKFRATEKTRPVSSIIDLIYWYKLIKVHRIDVIHVNEHDNFQAIKLIARLTKTPVVVGVRFLVNHEFVKWSFGGKYIPDKVLFTSQDQLQRSNISDIIPKSKIKLLGNGRDLDELIDAPDLRSDTRLKWGVSDDEILIGTASVIRPRKKIEDLINLTKKLHERNIPVKCVIAGGGKFADPVYYKELEDLIVTEKLGGIVTMLGNLDNLAPFYQSLDIFISTSELETFGMSVCEAMAFAKPVVAYEGGSVQEVLADPECVVPTGDQDALFNKTLKFINDPDLSKKIAEKGKERVFKHFNAPVLASRLMSIYNELIE